MALNRYNRHPLGYGFDELFSPSPFFRDPFFDRSLVPTTFWQEPEEMSNFFRGPPLGYRINEKDNEYQISVDVPGVKASDMSVNLENDGKVLHIVGGRKVEKENEISETRFEKRFTIGDNVDTDKLKANLSDGVLVLTAPKLEKKKPEAQKIVITEEPHKENLEIAKKK